MSGGNRTKGQRFELVFAPELWAELVALSALEQLKLADYVRAAVKERCEKSRKKLVRQV